MKNKILFVLSILFGLMFINAGLNKFFQYIPPPDNLPENMANIFECMVEFQWLMPLIAIVEIVGGILFMIPKYRALGAIMLVPLMAGILLTHIVNYQAGLPMALVLVAIQIWVIYENKDKYLVMIR